MGNKAIEFRNTNIGNMTAKRERVITKEQIES
jgi:hypothetical protein